MREILFRAKRADNKGWVEGLLTVMWGQYHIIKPSDENTAYPIEPETVCQYIGLTDKNGKKIFEGDILEIETGNITKEDGYFTVEWSEPGSSFALCGNRYLAYFDNCYEDCREVIGNIFDNPELLEGKDKQ